MMYYFVCFLVYWCCLGMFWVCYKVIRVNRVWSSLLDYIFINLNSATCNVQFKILIYININILSSNLPNSVCCVLSMSVCSCNIENRQDIDDEASFTRFTLMLDSVSFLRSFLNTCTCLAMRLSNDMLRFIRRVPIQQQITAFDIREGTQPSSWMRAVSFGPVTLFMVWTLSVKLHSRQKGFNFNFLQNVIAPISH